MYYRVTMETKCEARPQTRVYAMLRRLDLTINTQSKKGRGEQGYQRQWILIYFGGNGKRIDQNTGKNVKRKKHGRQIPKNVILKMDRKYSCKNAIT